MLRYALSEQVACKKYYNPINDKTLKAIKKELSKDLILDVDCGITTQSVNSDG